MRSVFAIPLLILLVSIGCERDRGPEAPRKTAEHSDDEHPHPKDEAEEHARGTDRHSENELRIRSEMLRDLRITTAPVETRAGRDGVAMLGEIRVNEEAYAEVGSPIGARVARLLAGVSQDVTAGRSLAELVSVELGKARADYLTAKARADVARKALERKRGLAAERIVPARELQEAEARASAAEANLRASRATFRALGGEAPDAAADEDPSRFAIRSPLNGTVIERNAVVGKFVEPATAVFHVADLSRLWLTVHAFERDAVRCAPEHGPDHVARASRAERSRAPSRSSDGRSMRARERSPCGSMSRTTIACCAPGCPRPPGFRSATQATTSSPCRLRRSSVSGRVGSSSSRATRAPSRSGRRSRPRSGGRGRDRFRSPARRDGRRRRRLPPQGRGREGPRRGRGTRALRRSDDRPHHPRVVSQSPSSPSLLVLAGAAARRALAPGSSTRRLPRSLRAGLQRHRAEPGDGSRGARDRHRDPAGSRPRGAAGRAPHSLDLPTRRLARSPSSSSRTRTTTARASSWPSAWRRSTASFRQEPKRRSSRASPDGLNEIFEFTLEAEPGAADLMTLRDLAEFEVRNRLLAVPGVAAVERLGGYLRQFQVQLDPDRMSARGRDARRSAARGRGREPRTPRAASSCRGPWSGRCAPWAVPTRSTICGRRSSRFGARRRCSSETSPNVREAPAVRRGIAHRLRGEVVSCRVVKQFGADTVRVPRASARRSRDLRRALPTGVEAADRLRPVGSS